MAAAEGVLLLFWLVWLGGVALWIWAIVDVARTPEHAFRLVGREKTSWVLVVVLAQWVGALIWRFGSAREEVRQAAAANPFRPPVVGPPAGWYPDPAGGHGSVWWDGRRWTGHRQQDGPPPPNPDFEPPVPPGPTLD